MTQTHLEPVPAAALRWRVGQVSLMFLRLIMRVLVPAGGTVELRLADSATGRPAAGRGAGRVMAQVRAPFLRWSVGVPAGSAEWGQPGPSRKVAARELVARVAGAFPERRFHVTADGWFMEAKGRPQAALPANVTTGGPAPRTAAGDSAAGDSGSGDSAAGDSGSEAVRAGGPSRASIVAAVTVSALVAIGVDQWTKQLVLDARPHGTPILGGLFYLDLTFNSGAAFSLGTGYTWVFPIIAIIVTGVIAWMARSTRSMPWAVALGLIAGGAVGNMLDRLFRAPGPFRGYVVDFISVFAPNGQYFPIWNMADTALTIGVALAVLLEFTGRHRDGTRAARGGRQGDGA